MDWEFIAKYLEKEVGCFVDWCERFFVCPDCGEPVYESDWTDYNAWGKCPICEFDYIRAKMR